MLQTKHPTGPLWALGPPCTHHLCSPLCEPLVHHHLCFALCFTLCMFPELPPVPPATRTMGCEARPPISYMSILAHTLSTMS